MDSRIPRPFLEKRFIVSSTIGPGELGTCDKDSVSRVEPGDPGRHQRSRAQEEQGTPEDVGQETTTQTNVVSEMFTSSGARETRTDSRSPTGTDSGPLTREKPLRLLNLVRGCARVNHPFSFCVCNLTNETKILKDTSTSYTPLFPGVSGHV